MRISGRGAGTPGVVAGLSALAVGSSPASSAGSPGSTAASAADGAGRIASGASCSAAAVSSPRGPELSSGPFPAASSSRPVIVASWADDVPSPDDAT
jgi:hypothetical protein